MILLIFVGSVLASTCLFLVTRGLFNQRLAEVQATLDSSPVRSLVVGMGTATAIFGICIGLIATEIPPLAIGSVIVGTIGILGVLFGLSSIVSILGERVLALRNRESSPFAQTILGTLLLATLGIVPFLGWFLIAPVAVFLGLGSLVLSTARRRRASLPIT